MPGGLVTCGATARMIEDVSKKVLLGQAVPTTPGAWTIDHSTKSKARALGRYVNRNKRKIVVSTAALVVTGILTGGVAVGIAVAGKAAGFIGGRVYRRWEKWRNEGQIRVLFPDLVDAQSGKFKTLDFVIDAQGGAAEKAAAAIRAIKVLIQHRDFSSMVNVFADLMEAGQAFQTKFDGARGGVRSCAQSIEVLEAMFLLKYHYERLAPVINFLDQYLLFIFLRSQTMEAEFAQLAPGVIERVVFEETDPMGFLNKIANSSPVLHTHSIFSGDKDQKAWVKAALNPWADQYALEGRSRRMETEETLGQTVQHAATSSIPMTVASSGTGFGGSQATTEIIKATGGKVVDPGLVTSLSTGGGEVAVSILSEIANAKWNAEQYKTGKTLGLTGSRDITVSERVQLMKTMLKGSLDRLTTKFEHWMVSHKQFQDAVAQRKPLAETCTAMLRSRKHWAQSVGSEAFKMLAEFQETVVGTANLEHNKIFESASKAALMEAFMHRGSSGHYAEASVTTSTEGITGDTTRADMMQGVIDDYVKAHTNGPCDRTYCYMPVKLLSNFGFNITSFRPSDEDYPIFPIGTAKFIDLDD